MKRNLTKIAHEFKNLLDDGVKLVVSKEDIHSLKIFFRLQSDMIRFRIENNKFKEKCYDN